MTINQNNWFVIIKKTSIYRYYFYFFIFQCNQFFFELYEVYWLCLKNYGHFSTLNRTKLLFNQLSSMKNEYGKKFKVIAK